MEAHRTSIRNIIQAMGLVFGDIGTSPIYTFTVIFLTTKVTAENIVSILSLIIWTLLLIVTVQYTWLAMSLSKRGEGGTIVLNEVLRKLLKGARSIVFFSFLTYIGISLLIGDSVITPAISILSAVEGLKLIPGLEHIPQAMILIITLVITILLFSIQKKGTEHVSRIFGPIMLIWFFALGVSGVVIISESHLAIHTWPELGYAAVDLFTCGDSCDPKVSYEYLKEKFNSKNASYRELKRGIIDEKTQKVAQVPFELVKQ